MGCSTVCVLYTGSDHECSGDFRVRQRIYKRGAEKAFIRTSVPLHRIDKYLECGTKNHV